MMHISNLTRAGRAQAVLQSYVEAKGEVSVDRNLPL
jgi:hypothetical protein